MLTLITWVGYCLSCFSSVKLPPFPPLFHTVLFGKKSLWEAHTLVWGVNPPPCGQGIYINCLKFFCMGDMSLLLHFLFFQSSTSVWTHGYLFYTLGYNPILLCFVPQIVPLLAIGSSFIWLLHFFDIRHCGFSLCLFLWALPYFLALQDATGLSCTNIFLAPLQESAVYYFLTLGCFPVLVFFFLFLNKTAMNILENI